MHTRNGQIARTFILILVSCLMMLMPSAGRAALTSEIFEKFTEGSGTVLNSGSPGQFSSISAGSLTCKLRGPIISGGNSTYGNSGDPMGNFTANFDLTGGAGANTIGTNVGGVAEAWYFVTNSLGVNGSLANDSENASLMMLYSTYITINELGITTDNAAGGIVGWQGYTPNLGSKNFGTAQNFTLPYQVWLRCCWFNNAGTYSRQTYYSLDGVTWTALNASAPTSGNPTWTKVVFSNGYRAGTTYNLRMRLGAAQLYKCTSTADWTAASATSNPANPLPSVTFNIDPLNGSDSNDGITAPWLTLGHFSTESLAMGPLPVANPSNGNGDIVVLDNRYISPYTSGSPIWIATDGLWFKTNAGTLNEAFQPYATLAGNVTNWTAVVTDGAGHTLSHTYSTPMDVHSTCRENLATCPIVCLSASSGAISTASTNNGAQTCGQFVDATPGCTFVNDSTGTVYYHAADSGNMTTNGKNYYVSRALSGAFLQYAAAGIRITGVKLQFAMLDTIQGNYFIGDQAPGTGSGSNAIYCGPGGNITIENCDLRYGDKHNLGFTAQSGGLNSGAVSYNQSGSTSSFNLIVNNCTFEQASYNGGSPIVNYMALGGGTGNVCTYSNCVCTLADSIQGAASGATGGADVWINHGSGTPTQQAAAPGYSLVAFNKCNFSGGQMDFQGNSTAITNFGGTWYDATLYANSITINGVTFTGNAPTGSNSGVAGANAPVVILENSIIVPANLNFGHGTTTYGNWTVQGCTFDLSQAGSQSGSAIWNPSANTLSLTFQNNIVIGNSTGLTLWYDLTPSNTITSNHNEWSIGTGLLTRQWNGTTDKTYAQWQALGFDAASVNLATLPISLTTYIPSAPGAVTNSLGQLNDYTGFVFSSRQTPGAYEFISPAGTGVYTGSLFRRFGGRNPGTGQFGWPVGISQ